MSGFVLLEDPLDEEALARHHAWPERTRARRARVRRALRVADRREDFWGMQTEEGIMEEQAAGAKEQTKDQKAEAEFLRPLLRRPRRKGVCVYDVESKRGDTQEAGFTRPFMITFYDGETFRIFRNDESVMQDEPLDPERHVRCPNAEDEEVELLDEDARRAQVAEIERAYEERLARLRSLGVSMAPVRDPEPKPPTKKGTVRRCLGCELCLSQRHLRPGGCVDKFLRFVLGMERCPACQNDWSTKRWRKKNCICKRLAARYRSRKVNIYAHNGGRFDHLFPLGWLRQQGETWAFEIAAVQSRIQRLEVWPRYGKKKDGFVFLDSVSLLPMTLKKIGETFCAGTGGIQKRAMDLDAHENDPEWDAYNRDDCGVLHHGLQRFHTLIEKDLGGEVGVTAPATAMKLFRRRYLGKQWIHRNAHLASCDGLCHGKEESPRDAQGDPIAPCERLQCDGTCHGCAHQWVRRGYYGGRTEMFQEWAPKGAVYYDLNSSYPTSMLDPMPTGKMREPDTSRMTVSQALRLFAKLRRRHVGFVECVVHIPKDCAVAPLPSKDPKDGKLKFMTGWLSGVWDYDELMLLDHPLVRGKIVSIKRSVWYEARPCFKMMVERIYSYRDKKRPDYDQGLDAVAKLMLNSLYGKFGMQEVRSGLVCIDPSDPANFPEYGVPINGDHDHCDIWEVERIVSASYIIPQISAHITALSRIRLFHGMIGVVERGGTLVYLDTDSMVLYGTTVPSGSKLGEWKQEEVGIFMDGEFILPKLYRLRAHEDGCEDPSCQGCRYPWHRADCQGKDDKSCPGCAAQKLHMKGIPMRSQLPETWNAVMPKSKGGRGEETHFTRVAQHRTLLNKNISTPIVVSGKKSIRTSYDKRVLLTDGTTRSIYVERTLALAPPEAEEKKPPLLPWSA